MRRRRFQQVDVFAENAYEGNPVAVVLEGEALSDQQMLAFANWTNLSETTFILPPTDARADYRVRIFTPTQELPFAGHPTLGTAHAWLSEQTAPPAHVVQECAAGLIPVRRTDTGLAFAAPPLNRSGPVDENELNEVAEELGVARADIVDAAWVDNGPGWVAVRLVNAQAVNALAPTRIRHDIGVLGFFEDSTGPLYEVRAFFPQNGIAQEDPVTGSLNAGIAQWLLGEGTVQAPYSVTQGRALGRSGTVQIDRTDEGTVWVGGNTITCINGTVEL